jgi:cell division transport system ATP-binding protein
MQNLALSDPFPEPEAEPDATATGNARAAAAAPAAAPEVPSAAPRRPDLEAPDESRPVVQPGPAAIECSRICKLYGRGVYALRDLSLTVSKGEFIFLTGPSGAGKSTLLRLLLRKEVQTTGELYVDGHDLSRMRPWDVQAYRRTLGFVFQDFKLIPRQTVLENVAFVLRVLGESLEQQRRRTFQVLKWVGLQHRMNAYPAELSGGEQQRVAIARAIVNEPGMIFADEPTGNLDPDLSLEVMNLFREINNKGTTVVVATHDRELIRRVGRKAITMDHGRIVDIS